MKSPSPVQPCHLSMLCIFRYQISSSTVILFTTCIIVKHNLNTPVIQSKSATEKFHYLFFFLSLSVPVPLPLALRRSFLRLLTEAIFFLGNLSSFFFFAKRHRIKMNGVSMERAFFYNSRTDTQPALGFFLLAIIFCDIFFQFAFWSFVCHCCRHTHLIFDFSLSSKEYIFVDKACYYHSIVRMVQRHAIAPNAPKKRTNIFTFLLNLVDYFRFVFLIRTF